MVLVKHSFTACLLAIALSGCAVDRLRNEPAQDQQASARVEAQPSKETEAESPPEAEIKAPELRPASFKPETLYTLLVAELAGQRGRYDILLSGYLSQAKTTGDPGVAERATVIASYLRADDAALAAATLWQQAAPENPEAMEALSIQLVKANRHVEALDLMEKLLRLGEDPRFEYLTVNAREITQSQRNQMVQRLNLILKEYPQNHRLLVGKAVLLQINGRIQEALSTALELREMRDDEQSVQLVARLYHQTGETERALQLLAQSLDLNPEQKQTRLLYGQLLIDNNELDQAQLQFAEMVTRFPEDGQLRLTLALIYLENEVVTSAREHLLELTGDPELAEEAFFYLAQIAEQENDLDSAIDYYSQVNSGEKTLASYSRLGTLLLQRNQPQEMAYYFSQARENNSRDAKSLYMLQSDLLSQHAYIEDAISVLNEALDSYQNDINILYSRAVTAEKLEDLDAMERDFRAILKIEPDNAAVLNALGYTLANRTNRHEEALQLISRANELRPNDPAITDSLGWVFYHLGNYEEAVRLLSKAFADFPDHEVAAHLGEALWASGERTQAKEVWQDALEKTPDSPILKEVVQRLSPELMQ